MEKIYLVMFDNGADYEDYRKHIYAGYEDLQEAQECARLLQNNTQWREEVLTSVQPFVFEEDSAKVWVQDIIFFKKGIDIRF